jgi:glycosyltransferase involved in cell wall biosynthesis
MTGDSAGTRRLRVLHVVEDLGTGGLEKVIYSLITGMDAARFESSAWCLARGGAIAEQLAREGRPVRIFDMSESPTPGFIFRLAGALRSGGFDIVHTHGYTAATVGRVAAVLARVPVVFAHVHSTYYGFTSRQRAIDRFLARFSDRVICCSEAVRSFVVSDEGIAPEKTTVIYNAVQPPSQILPDPALRARLGIGDETVIGCVASLSPHKGHRYLLEAAAGLLRSGRNIKVLLAGDGTERAALEAQARTLGITDNVVFAGRVENVWPYLALTDVFVLPSSEREGLGISLVEALFASRRVAASDIGGIPEVVKDGETGLLVKPRDAAALRSSIEWLLDNPEKGAQMAAAGARFAAERFGHAAIMNSYAGLYLAAVQR